MPLASNSAGHRLTRSVFLLSQGPDCLLTNMTQEMKETTIDEPGQVCCGIFHFRLMFFLLNLRASISLSTYNYFLIFFTNIVF
jgi:hypothetical protein